MRPNKIIYFSSLFSFETRMFCRIAVDEHVGDTVCCDWVIGVAVDVP